MSRTTIARAGVLAPILLFLSACSGPTSLPPILSYNPPLPVVPDVDDVEPLAVPPDEPATITVPVVPSSLAPVSIQSERFCLGQDNRVVIGIPASERLRRELEGAGSGGASNKGFTTAAFFSSFEQELEKALIGKGLQVVDRNALEAELRTRRDESGGRDLGGFGYEEEKTYIQESYAAGRVSANERDNLLDALERRYTQGAAGTKRDSNEMADNAEVIRAVQEGRVRAKYLLMINNFSVSLGGADRTAGTAVFVPVRHARSSNGEILPDFSRYPGIESQLMSVARSPWYKAVTSAKLIEVDEGEIVWMGSVVVHSPQILEADFNLSLQGEVHITNRSELESARRRVTDGVEAQARQCRSARRRLESAYEEALQPTTRPIESMAIRSEKEKREELKASRRAIEACLEELDGQLEQAPSRAAGAPEDIEYRSLRLAGFSPGIRDPLERGTDAEDIRAYQRHRVRLARSAAASLLKTMTVKGSCP